MKNHTTKFKLLALAVGMAVTPGVMALELSSVGVGYTPASTFRYSDMSGDGGSGGIPSLNADFRITGPTPLFLRGVYMREGPDEAGDGVAHVASAAILYQFREGKPGFRPYVLGGMSHMFTTGGVDEPANQTAGLAGVGIRHTIAGKVEFDLGYSVFLGVNRVSFLTAGLNYKF